jgi:pantothenate kinase type III
VLRVPSCQTGSTRFATLLVPARIPLLQAGIDLPCPLPLAYETPHTLGADRWVTALAAHRRHGRAVVVDCGSATTVNLVEADGTFHGGAIARVCVPSRPVSRR